VISGKSKEMILKAIELGWDGPPYDPFEMARLMGVATVPRGDTRDARLISTSGKKLRIEYNPNRPPTRIRFSVAHELGHSLFPDCHERVRKRLAPGEMRDDEWQIEALCNLAASEILMPFGYLKELTSQHPSMETLLGLRDRLVVSTEALLLRYVKLCQHPCMMFCASACDGNRTRPSYKIDYAVPSPCFSSSPRPGVVLPKSSCVADCTAIGYTAKGNESWPTVGDARVECVGAPSYPGEPLPRVVGLLFKKAAHCGRTAEIEYVRGDATEPHGRGAKIIAHVVNDKARAWGAGFGYAVRMKWPDAQQAFKDWIDENSERHTLGSVKTTRLGSGLFLFTMIAQHGYGPSRRPRIRYMHLSSCLEMLAALAEKQKASIHMPRLGCGEGGGAWFITEQMIHENLCSRGLHVTVYDLPSRRERRASQQLSLFGGNTP